MPSITTAEANRLMGVHGLEMSFLEDGDNPDESCILHLKRSGLEVVFSYRSRLIEASDILNRLGR